MKKISYMNIIAFSAIVFLIVSIIAIALGNRSELFNTLSVITAAITLGLFPLMVLLSFIYNRRKK